MTAPSANSKTQTPKGGWTPGTKAQASMAPHYRGWSPERRMEAAVKLVLESEDGPAHLKISQSEAARQCGVTRPKLNQRIQEYKRKLADQQERSKEANKPPNIAVDERARFPTLEEFDDLYFSDIRCTDCIDPETGEGVHHDLAPFHREIMQKVTDPSMSRLIINVPPFHAKSLTATIKSTVYEIAKNPNSQTLVICASKDLAKKFLRSMKKFLEDEHQFRNTPRNLIEDYGPFRNEVDRSGWGAEAIYVVGRQSAEKDPTVEARSVNSNIYGSRFTRILFDDIADFKNQKNPELVSEMYNWIQQEPLTRIGGKSGKATFVGTRVRPGEIYSRLAELPGYEVIRYPCILDEETELTLWPDHFGWKEACRQRATMGPMEWQLVFQQVDTDFENASFKEDALLASHDPSRGIGHTEPEWALVAGLDPGGAGVQAGFTAMILLGVDLKSGKRHLVDLVNHRSMKAPQIMDQIYDWAERYPRLRELRVEVNGLQGQIFQYNDELNARLTNKGIRIVPHITHGHNKMDPEFGVESMAPLYYNTDMISTPAKDLVSRNKFKELERQLLAFPAGMPNDLVMAMWFAELGCREIFSRETMPMFSPRLKVPNRLRRKRGVIDFSERSLRRPTASEERGGYEQEAVNPIPFINISAKTF